MAPGSNGETQASGSETQTSDSETQTSDSETQALDIEAQTSDNDSETSDSDSETSGGETSGGDTQMSDCGPAPIPDMHVAKGLPACMQESGVLRVDHELDRVWVTEGGHEIDLEMPGSISGTSVNGDWIAVASYGYNSRFLGVFARHTGERVWCRNVDHAVPWDWEGWGGMGVSEDGQTVVTQVTPVPHMDNYFPETVLLISAESAWSWSANGRVVADPALGYVVVEKVVDPFVYSTTTGWLGLDDHIFHEILPEPTYISAAVGEDDHTLDYWYQGSYVRARIGESKSIALQPDGSGLGAPGVFYIESYGICPNHLLLRYDVETGNILPIDPEPPPGWSFVPIDLGLPSVPCNSRLDYEGTTLYFLLYQDTEAQLWAYDIEGDMWEAVGLPFTDCVDAVGYGSFRLKMVSHDVIMVTTKCSWDESEFEYRLLRRDPPFSLTLQVMEDSYSDFWSSIWLKIDSQQQCAAHLTDDGWEVVTLDGSDEVFHAGDVSWSWLD